MKKYLSVLLAVLILAGVALSAQTCSKKKKPDLTITKIKVTPSNKDPHKLTIQYTIKNQGSTASPASQSQLSVSGSDQLIVKDTPPLKPNNSYTTTVQYDIAQEGNYQIKATADYLNKVPELNELNNSNKISFGISHNL